jgi:hypothetical protein
MKARVDDAVHVQVQVVKLDAVGVGLRRVDRGDQRSARAGVGASEHARSILDAVDDDFWVALAEPAVEGWDSHGG